MDDNGGPEKELTHWPLESWASDEGMMQFDVLPDIAENVLCEDTQTVRPCACDLLSTPKSLDFFEILQVIFWDLRCFGFYAAYIGS
jgi:hypothetical protein